MLRRLFREHRALAVTVGVAGLAAVVAVLVWFQPQGLFIDERIDESLPGGAELPEPATAPSTIMPPTTVSVSTRPASTTAAETTAATTSTTTTSTTSTTTTLGPVVLSDTQLANVGRDGSGRVLIIELPDGRRIVRLEDLDVVNGPDLVVILSPSPLVDDRDAYDDGDFLDIGELKANQGNQNYDIPADAELDDYGSVAIWCRRFNYTFNAAAIELDV